MVIVHRNQITCNKYYVSMDVLGRKNTSFSFSITKLHTFDSRAAIDTRHRLTTNVPRTSASNQINDI